MLLFCGAVIGLRFFVDARSSAFSLSLSLSVLSVYVFFRQPESNVSKMMQDPKIIILDRYF